MKKSILCSILALCISVLAFGQEGEAVSSSSGAGLVSKKGVNILPEAGEIVLGVNATSFLNYAGNALNLGGNAAPGMAYSNPGFPVSGIYVKYMLSDNMAARAKVRADFSSSTAIHVVDMATPNPDPLNPLYVEDEVNTQTNNLELGLGVEMRRGSSRVQGIYGGELLVGSNKSELTYIYGNSINNENGDQPATHNGYVNGRRVIKDYNDKGMFFGARGFIGVEFFIGPKVSLGGEFGYAYMMTVNENRVQEWEFWNTETQAVDKLYTETTAGGIKRHAAGIDNLVDGQLNLFFYF